MIQFLSRLFIYICMHAKLMSLVRIDPWRTTIIYPHSFFEILYRENHFCISLLLIQTSCFAEQHHLFPLKSLNSINSELYYQHEFIIQCGMNCLNISWVPLSNIALTLTIDCWEVVLLCLTQNWLYEKISFYSGSMKFMGLIYV